MSSRSIALLSAATLVAATGATFAVGGLLLLGLASGRLPFLDSVRPSGPLLALGFASLLAAGIAWVGAIDLSRGHTRGWAASLLIGIVALDGVLTTLLTSSAQVPLLAGLVLTAATVVALLAPRTRIAVGIAQAETAPA